MTVFSFESNVEWSVVMILVSRVVMSIAEPMTSRFSGRHIRESTTTRHYIDLG